MTSNDRRVLLVIGGGIAAFKALDLMRAFRRLGISVTPVLTAAAQHFVTPLSAAALSGSKVYTDLFSLTDEAEMGHIELSRSADLIVVAPATADLLAKMTHGLCDDLASTLLLATDKKILAAPAMNLRMWLHPATARNVAQLRSDGVAFAGPDDGEMACGDFGPGRMAEPDRILATALELLDGDTAIPLPGGAAQSTDQNVSLKGRHVVVTSGPTHEPIDPVRYIANRSSGRQGHAIAAAAAAAGARVTLVAGPVEIPPPIGVKTVSVATAAEMLGAVEQALPADIFIAAAAVADWRASDASASKIKKKGKSPQILKLVENPDILQTISLHPTRRPTLVVGFAAETDDLIANAQKKLQKKRCDLIIANDVRPETGIMGGDENTVHIVTRNGIEEWPKMSKIAVASRMIVLLAGKLGDRRS